MLFFLVFKWLVFATTDENFQIKPTQTVMKVETKR